MGASSVSESSAVPGAPVADGGSVAFGAGWDREERIPYSRIAAMSRINATMAMIFFLKPLSAASDAPRRATFSVLVPGASARFSS